MCLMHAPCSEGFHPFKPRDCATCSAAAVALLEHTSLARMEPESVPLCYHWANLVRLHHQQGRVPSQADPKLPVVLSMDSKAPSSTSSLLRTLLEDPQPEEPFQGFAAGLGEHDYVFPQGQQNQSATAVALVSAELSWDILPDLEPECEPPQALSLPSAEVQPVEIQASEQVTCTLTALSSLSVVHGMGHMVDRSSAAGSQLDPLQAIFA